MAINETKQYTELLPSGKAWQFFLPREVKSFITRPSPGLTLKGPGFYEISGLAYSGYGPINKVEVSADGGKSWALAVLDAPVLSKSFTRFRIPWNWSGQAAILQSRATDEAGGVEVLEHQAGSLPVFDTSPRHHGTMRRHAGSDRRDPRRRTWQPALPADAAPIEAGGPDRG